MKLQKAYTAYVEEVKSKKLKNGGKTALRLLQLSYTSLLRTRLSYGARTVGTSGRRVGQRGTQADRIADARRTVTDAIGRTGIRAGH